MADPDMIFGDRTGAGRPLPRRLAITGSALFAACMSRRAEAQDFLARPIEVENSQLGQYGNTNIGVMSIAPDGLSAKISLGGIVAEMQWGTSFTVRKGSLVPTATRALRVTEIIARSASPRARVIMAPVRDAEQTPAVGPLSVIMPFGGSLLVGGPKGVGPTTSVRSTGVSLPGVVGQADVEWWQGSTNRADVPASAIRAVTLVLGTRLDLGKASLTVSAVEMEAPWHPAWVVLTAG